MTFEELKSLAPGTIFSSGTKKISNIGYYSKPVTVRWVAVRGNIHDWAIYWKKINLKDVPNLSTDNAIWKTSFMAGFDEAIKNHGNKLHDMNTVVELVPCDEEMKRLYRH